MEANITPEMQSVASLCLFVFLFLSKQEDILPFNNLPLSQLIVVEQLCE